MYMLAKCPSGSVVSDLDMPIMVDGKACAAINILCNIHGYGITRQLPLSRPGNVHCLLFLFDVTLSSIPQCQWIRCSPKYRSEFL